MATLESSPRAGTSLPARRSAAAYVVVLGVVVAVVLGTVLVLLSSSSSPGYTVTFDESGLPAGTQWSVTLNGMTEFSSASNSSTSISFTEVNGRYNFSVSLVSGYTPTPETGWVTVNGQGTGVNVSYVRNGIPLGSAFAMGNPTLATCPSGDTFADNGCNAGDYTYSVTIEASAVEFGSVLLVVKTNTDSNFTVLPGPGGFSVINITGGVAAEINSTKMGNHLWMTTTWASFGTGVEPSSPLTPLYSFLVDVGQTDTLGLGLTLVAYGAGGYTGSTAPLALP